MRAAGQFGSAAAGFPHHNPTEEVASLGIDALRERLRLILIPTGVEPPPPALLATALTHASCGHEAGEQGEDNERLEFLGDAVLGLCAARLLYSDYPGLDPGEMTRLRAEVVSGDALAEVARDWRLGSALRLGRGEEANGGRTRPTNLSRALEAVVGAVYLAGGIAAAMAVARAVIGDRLTAIVPDSAVRDPKSALQEWAQSHGQVPVYEVIGREGPDHAPRWTVSVKVGSRSCRATAGSQRQAEKDAARSLLAELSETSNKDLL